MQAPMEVRFPFRHEQLKAVHLLLQLYWTMYSHAFGTGGSIESLTTRCPLSTFHPNMLVVGFEVYPCRVVVYLCQVINPVQLTDEFFCILNLGRCEVSFSKVLK